MEPAPVMGLIHQTCGIEMQIRTVGLYLQRCGFMPQRPVKRALEQCPAKVGQWLKTEYPAIKTRAKAEDSEIY